VHKTYLLGVDAGGTHTVCPLADDTQHILGRGEAGPANMMAVGLVAAAAAVREAVGQAWRAAGRAPRPAAVACIGMSGAGRLRDRQALAGALPPYGLARRAVIVSDALIALAAGSPRAVGVVVIAGTGAIAWGRNRAGEERRASGWGYILGDEGSAFDIGLAALRAVARAHDGCGQPTLLTALILEHWRLSQPEDLRSIVYSAPSYRRPEVAALAPIVEQAARQGDVAALDIYACAAEELALAAKAVIGSLGMQAEPVDIVLSGGVYNAGDLIVEPFLRAVREVAPRAQPIRLEQEPAMGAVHLAAQYRAEHR